MSSLHKSKILPSLKTLRINEMHRLLAYDNFFSPELRESIFFHHPNDNFIIRTVVAQSSTATRNSQASKIEIFFSAQEEQGKEKRTLFQGQNRLSVQSHLDHESASEDYRSEMHHLCHNSSEKEPVRFFSTILSLPQVCKHSNWTLISGVYSSLALRISQPPCIF